MNDASAGLVPARREAWQWWEARRLRYNLGLAGAGWSAYALHWLLQFQFDGYLPSSAMIMLSQTLFLGLGFLVLMGVANILYLAGVAAETLIRPRDVDGFRERMWRLGFWGSVALPFLFPIATLSVTLAFGQPF